MDKIYDNCCGIDVHKKLIVACFQKGNKQVVREFGATTRELLEMADWLRDGSCEMAAMETRHLIGSLYITSLNLLISTPWWSMPAI